MAQQAVGVFVGAALPGAPGITKIDVHVDGQGKTPVVGKLLAAVPGERLIELAGQFAGLFDQRRNDAGGILVGDFDQHHVARMAFNKRRDIAIPRSTYEVTLPMAWHRPIFNRRRPLADGYGILDLAEPVSFHAGVPGSADRAPRPQVLKKLLFQHAARLNEQAAIDRLV